MISAPIAGFTTRLSGTDAPPISARPTLAIDRCHFNACTAFPMARHHSAAGCRAPHQRPKRRLVQQQPERRQHARHHDAEQHQPVAREQEIPYDKLAFRPPSGVWERGRGPQMIGHLFSAIIEAEGDHHAQDWIGVIETGRRRKFFKEEVPPWRRRRREHARPDRSLDSW